MFNTKVENGIFINTADAEYTFADLIAYVRDNIHIWERSPLIWDLTQFPLRKDDTPGLMVKELLSHTLTLAEQRRGQRTAFVVTQDYDFGMFRMFCTFSECLEFPFVMMVFRSAVKAQIWIKSNT